ncbi:MAG: hypothetical protein M3081_05470 [Gemmatimonadota bacterium]|nr:hypothetical protein [Gemmatimonadota bacterium]
MAHQLHHIGFAAACGDEPAAPRGDERVGAVLHWASAFGEGLAMLAAAGSPAVHPHAADDAETRGRWDRDVANAPADLETVQRFFFDLLANRFPSADSAQSVAMSFLGVQRPWYTVGYVMASTIERVRVRATLVATVCDSRQFFAAYNDAARAPNAATPASATLPLWSDSLLARLASP